MNEHFNVEFWLRPVANKPEERLDIGTIDDYSSRMQRVDKFVHRDIPRFIGVNQLKHLEVNLFAAAHWL